jgi:hypothetical protein
MSILEKIILAASIAAARVAIPYINILLCMLFNLTCALFILVLGYYLCMKIFKNVFRIF